MAKEFDKEVIDNFKAWRLDLPNPLILFFSLIFVFIIVLGVMIKIFFPYFMDEAIFFEIIARFNQGNDFSSTLFQDFIPLVKFHSYWYPPLYFLLLAPLYQIFGPTILVGRVFSLFCAVGSIILLTLFSKQQKVKKYGLVLIVTLLMLDPYFQEGSVIARMEMMSIALGLGALVLHMLWLKNYDHKLQFLTGIVTALGILTHPTNIILTLPIALNILLTKQKNLTSKIYSLAIFILPISVGVGWWLLSMLPQWSTFWVQNLIQLHRKQFGIYFILESIRFKPLYRILLLAYIFSNIWYIIINFRQKIRQKESRVLLFLAVTSIFLTLLMKEMWYVLYLPIIAVLTMVKNFSSVFQNKNLLKLTTSIIYRNC